ncbi:methyltransferase domain-containing protein [Candidatus Pelagibacter ubique]|nr:methyltransferase domain-containing protein [Candidatus Pelagibacter ubique]
MIDNFICPKCKGKLKIENNYLICKRNQSHIYYIYDNIFSFFHKKSFDKHWSENSNSDLPKSKLNVAKNFLTPLIKKHSPKKKKTILDVGCGDGVHATVLANKKNSHLKINYIGLDISKVALGLTAKRMNKGWYLHASATSLPLNKESIDILISYGVIAYTQNPKKTLREFYRVLKKGGKLGIWVYLQPKGFKGVIFNFIRKITLFCGDWVSYRIADCIVPFLFILPVDSKINLMNASWRQCREIVLVNIQPKDLIFPSENQLIDWIKKANFKIEKIKNGKVYALKV